jgi:hydrogenase-4 component E
MPMVNYLIILFAVTLIYFASVERLTNYIRLISLQGLLLFGIAIFELKEINTANMLFIAAETLFIKTILVPYLLTRIIKRSGVTKVHRDAMPGFYLLILSISALLFSVILTQLMHNQYINSIFMAVALFTLFTGLLLIVTHRLIISHLIGFLVIENAVFLFSMAVGNRMPMLINIGILLDIFVGVLILVFFGLRLKPRTNELTMLKD